ncbi:ribonuclease H-like domain-containing protein [Tanacetum coccineum]
MGMVDNILFTKKKSSNLIIVQIYVDGIIFGSTCQDMCDEFAKIMHDEFKMSMMGELNFFLGLQINQMEDGIFFNQSKYIKEMLKKFGLEDSKLMKTPMSSDTKLMKDEECESIDSTKYRGMIDHNLWDVIVNGDLEEEPAPTGETSAPPAPKTAKQLAARRNQERVKSILLLAIPDEYLLKFHNVADAKSLWEAIKSRFGGNVESKKIQLEVHGAPISKEDINQKFLRSLPPSWNQIALIMRNKPDIDEIDIDDLYNNLRVYEDELKRSSGSNSASQNLAFLSSKNTSSTNEVSTASGDFGVSTAGGINQVPSTPCAHDVAYSFFAQPTTSPQLENEDFQQMDGDDLEELDLRWQVAMLTVRVKKKGHFARECRSRRNQGRRSYGDNGRSNAPINESSSQALLAQDGLGGYDWSNDFEVEPVNYALMTISSLSSSSSSDNEVQKWSKQCLESFKTLQKNYDTEREKHNKAKLEIRGYEIALELLESWILGHEKNELARGEKYEFQNYELKCREIKINNLNMELEKVVKEKDELKDKIAK